MSAEAFYVFYGLRAVVDASDAETVEALELRRHPWQLAAKQHRLRCWWGSTVDEYTSFVVLGHMVGQFGREGAASGQLTDAEASAVVAETTERLRAAGVEGQPAWHFQFEPDR